MNPVRLRMTAFLLLAAGCVGIIWFYHNVQQSISTQMTMVEKIQISFFQHLINELDAEAEAYVNQSGSDISRFLRQSNPNNSLKIEAFNKRRIDGMLLLNDKHELVFRKGVPISPDSFSVCLNAVTRTEGIHTCPVSGNTVIYSVLPHKIPGQPAYTLVFYRKIGPKIAREIERISQFPARFVPLKKATPNIPGFSSMNEVLNDQYGKPLVQLVTYFPNSLRRKAAILLVAMLILVLLMGFLAYITTSLSRTATLAKALRLKNHKLSKLTRQRETLLRILSHDLNNYLAVIKGYADLMLNRERNAPRQKEAFERILYAANKQSRVIDAVRRQIALESGKLQIQLEPVELRALLTQLQQDFQMKLAAKKVSLEICSQLNGASVLVDKTSFTENVLNNLLSNAIKFSFPESKIHICAGEKKRNIVLTVRDSGVGIPRDLLKKIWSASERTSRKGTAGEDGTGFGMPLVKKFVEAYGGEIRIDSRDIDSSPHKHGTHIQIILKKADPPTAEIDNKI